MKKFIVEIEKDITSDEMYEIIGTHPYCDDQKFIVKEIVSANTNDLCDKLMNRITEAEELAHNIYKKL